MNTLKYILLFTVAGFTAVACSSSSDSDQAIPKARINAVVKTGAQQKSNPAGLIPGSIASSNHVVLTEAKFLIEEIELESAIDEDSLDFEINNVVLNLNLTGGLTQIVISEIKPGVYDELEIDIHKPEDGVTPPDADFKIGDSGDERFSIILKGTVNGEAFVFRSRENFDIELEFPRNIVIDETNNTFDITLAIDVSKWFIDSQGNELNPLNPDHFDEIDENIKNSFEAFEDDDRDGEDDSEDDD